MQSYILYKIQERFDTVAGRWLTFKVIFDFRALPARPAQLGGDPL